MKNEVEQITFTINQLYKLFKEKKLFPVGDSLYYTYNDEKYFPRHFSGYGSWVVHSILEELPLPTILLTKKEIKPFGDLENRKYDLIILKNFFIINCIFGFLEKEFSILSGPLIGNLSKKNINMDDHKYFNDLPDYKQDKIRNFLINTYIINENASEDTQFLMEEIFKMNRYEIPY